MGLLTELSCEETWMRFYSYKASLPAGKSEAKQLLAFIENKEYLPVCERIANGDFPLPRRSIISKQSSNKKRVVYTYPYAENRVLKLLTYLMLRRYDYLFDRGLYSFRPCRCAIDAVRMLTRIPGIASMYSYKVDISNYFNSVPTELLIPMLQGVLADDPELFGFLSALLAEPKVLFRGEAIEDEKGIMAGTPIACFYANLYLRALDHHFYETGAPYCRYSDDIIVFARTREELEEHVRYIGNFLKSVGLNVNPAKESRTLPGEKWVFLGFSYENGTIDVAPSSVVKLKRKMRRKARALARWADRKGLDGRKAAKGFVNAFNKKLYEYADENDLTWARWFFPVITTGDSLRVLDRYAEDCIRYLASGTRTKKRFDVRYSDIKELGFRSLVHEYYAFNESEGDKP